MQENQMEQGFVNIESDTQKKNSNAIDLSDVMHEIQNAAQTTATVQNSNKKQALQDANDDWEVLSAKDTAQPVAASPRKKIVPSHGYF